MPWVLVRCWQLQTIPAADPGKYKRIQDMRNWRNPYLIVRSDGVGLLDPADNAEIVLKPEGAVRGLYLRQPQRRWKQRRAQARKSVLDGLRVHAVGAATDTKHRTTRALPRPARGKR